MTRLLAYVSYALGSTLFLVIALDRGRPLLGLGSALFLVGTLLLLIPTARAVWSRTSHDVSAARR